MMAIKSAFAGLDSSIIIHQSSIYFLPIHRSILLSKLFLIRNLLNLAMPDHSPERNENQPSEPTNSAWSEQEEARQRYQALEVLGMLMGELNGKYEGQEANLRAQEDQIAKLQGGLAERRLNQTRTEGEQMKELSDCFSSEQARNDYILGKLKGTADLKPGFWDELSTRNELEAMDFINKVLKERCELRAVIEKKNQRIIHELEQSHAIMDSICNLGKYGADERNGQVRRQIEKIMAL